jgi:hypothetical protein
MRNEAITSSNSGKFHDCEEVSPIKISISLVHYCFTLFSQLNEESDNRYLVDYDISSKYSIDPLIFQMTIFLYIHIQELNRLQKS